LLLASALASGAASCAAPEDDVSAQEGALAAAFTVSNESGTSQTYTASGTIDTTNAFFQSLGTNGRSCVSCHDPNDNWSITPARLQQRFNATGGTDPVFRTNDGSNSPLADVSTVAARQAAYSMLLTKGLIRVGLSVPAGAEFKLAATDDPYGFAGPANGLSLFRRPLPTANLKFLSTVMWDGRETLRLPGATDCLKAPLNPAICFSPLTTDFAVQANDATLGHAQAAVDLTAAQRAAIVAFEMGVFTAQTFDNDAQNLNALQADGGPANLAAKTFSFGANDVLSGDYATGAPFTPVVFHTYDAWINRAGGGTEAARRAVARGQALFNTKPIAISGVKGINDDLNVAVLNGTCTTCHDTPNAGNHSIPMPLDIGLTDESRRTPDMPLYTLECTSADPSVCTSGQTIKTTDPGRALITGKWKDIARFKGPILRALAGRAPYFHNGSAATLGQVVDFYDGRFAIGLTAQEKSDLVAFLRAL
jgi:cytochrome c peroxidase